MKKIIETSPASKQILEETRRRMAPRKARSAATLAAHRALRKAQRIESAEIVQDARERSQARLEHSRQARRAA